MDCAICRLPLEHHESALRVLGELPFDTVKSVLRHQWHKDIARITFAHAQYYHDQTLFEFSLTQKQQLQYLEADIKRHRTKFIVNYLHAVVEVYRHGDIGATRVTVGDEALVRLKLEEALNYTLPGDLDVVFRREKPFAWVGALTFFESKDRRESMRQNCGLDTHAFGPGSGSEVTERRLIMVIPMVVRLNGGGDEIDKIIMHLPKTPDAMWCWSQKTENIQAFHELTKLDLF
ncbi:hypothetical protein F5Y19DRAFT_480941 [Xylariaceae sp. FL1651]|nr:hypothetical protein F5Y19DRAFT_480941 [Xylariaceae sp. FL1651]